MYRIDNAKASTTLPTPDPVGVNPGGYFQTGTIVTHDVLNAWQEELCYVIEQAGITLSKTTNNQLITAFNQLLADNPATSGINAIVEDTSPKLGGDFFLTMGYKFSSESNGDITLTAPVFNTNSENISLFVHTNFYHIGDLDNYIQFGTNTINFITGGASRADINTLGLRVGGANARVNRFLSENNLISNSDTGIPTQQSLIAYATNRYNYSGSTNSIILYSTCGLQVVGYTTAMSWTQWGPIENPPALVSVVPPPFRFFCPIAGTIKSLSGKLLVTTNGPAFTQSNLVITIYKNTTATTCTHTISSGKANGIEYSFTTSFSFTVVAGDYIYIRIDKSANPTGGDNWWGTISLEYVY